MSSAITEALASIEGLADERPSELRRGISVLHTVATELATRLEALEQFARDAAEHTAPAPAPAAPETPAAGQEQEQTGG